MFEDDSASELVVSVRGLTCEAKLARFARNLGLDCLLIGEPRAPVKAQLALDKQLSGLLRSLLGMRDWSMRGDTDH